MFNKFTQIHNKLTSKKARKSKEEYMVDIWGGAWNSDANPSIEKDLGIKEGYHYFKTEEEKDAFCKLLQNPIYYNQGIAMIVKYGVMSHKRTIFVGTLEYKGKEYVIHYDFGYEYEEKYAKSKFLDGGYGCDCNLSLLIREEHGEDTVPVLDCGNEIKLKDYHIEYWD